MNRMLRNKLDGRWCEPLMAGDFEDDGAEYAEAAAKTLGLPEGSLEVVDSDADLRTGELHKDPNVTPVPEPPAKSTIEERLAALEVRVGALEILKP